MLKEKKLLFLAVLVDSYSFMLAESAFLPHFVSLSKKLVSHCLLGFERDLKLRLLSEVCDRQLTNRLPKRM